MSRRVIVLPPGPQSHFPLQLLQLVVILDRVLLLDLEAIQVENQFIPERRSYLERLLNVAHVHRAVPPADKFVLHLAELRVDLAPGPSGASSVVVRRHLVPVKLLIV